MQAGSAFADLGLGNVLQGRFTGALLRAGGRQQGAQLLQVARIAVQRMRR
jgi:hypothetical protein